MTADIINVGIFSPSVVLDLGRSQGIFDRHNLDIREHAVPNSPSQFESLASGALEVGFTNPDNAIMYRFIESNPLGQRLPVKIHSALDRGLNLSLWLAPGLSSLKEFGNGPLGVDVPTSGFALIGYDLLDRKGIDRSRYETVTLGSTPKRATALAQNTCRATVLNAGNDLKAAENGCVQVASVVECGPYMGTVLVTLSDHVASSEKMHRFRLALNEVTQLVLTGRDKGEVLASAQRVLRLSNEEAIAHYDILKSSDHGLVADGEIDNEAIGTALALREKHLPDEQLAQARQDLKELFV